MQCKMQLLLKEIKLIYIVFLLQLQRPLPKGLAFTQVTTYTLLGYSILIFYSAFLYASRVIEMYEYCIIPPYILDFFSQLTDQQLFFLGNKNHTPSRTYAILLNSYSIFVLTTQKQNLEHTISSLKTTSMKGHT